MNEIKWRYVKQLQSNNLIEEFEQAKGYKFDDAFKECIIKNNGGRPSSSVFDTNTTDGRTIMSLLSFNKSDKSNIWTMNDNESDDIGKKYIAFAIDNFGNLISFERETNAIVFWNHENGTIEKTAGYFKEFLAKLHNSD
ncbi:MAG: SMI1/KNR4 family protein [Synergistaceae bacterium]|jgi:hypothetical protein|nr:SMI1/KNR4 family protein [Synergistaceae bacterium]